MAVVSLHRLWELLFQPPPPPPPELIDAKRDLRVAIVTARLAAREQRRAARDTIDRIGDVTDLARNGEHR